MQNIHTVSKTTAPQPHSGSAKDWRALSDLLSIWALCGRSACRKARACRGDSRDCIARCAPLVPEDVRVWVAALMEYKRDGLRFDDARAALPPELEEAWAAWDETVRRIAVKRGPSPRARGGGGESAVAPKERRRDEPGEGALVVSPCLAPPPTASRSTSPRDCGER